MGDTIDDSNSSGSVSGGQSVIARAVKRQRPSRITIALAAIGGLLALFALAVVAIAAAPPNYSANLDQCRNGGVASPQTTWVQCAGPGSGNDGWVNGNAGASNSHYREGESISYRARVGGF